MKNFFFFLVEKSLLILAKSSRYSAIFRKMRKLTKNLAAANSQIADFGHFWSKLSNFVLREIALRVAFFEG